MAKIQTITFVCFVVVLCILPIVTLASGLKSPKPLARRLLELEAADAVLGNAAIALPSDGDATSGNDMMDDMINGMGELGENMGDMMNNMGENDMMSDMLGDMMPANVTDMMPPNVTDMMGDMMPNLTIIEVDVEDTGNMLPDEDEVEADMEDRPEDFEVMPDDAGTRRLLAEEADGDAIDLPSNAADMGDMTEDMLDMPDPPMPDMTEAEAEAADDMPDMPDPPDMPDMPDMSDAAEMPDMSDMPDDAAEMPEDDATEGEMDDEAEGNVDDATAEGEMADDSADANGE